MKRKVLPWLIVAVLVWYVSQFPVEAADLVKNVISMLPREGS